MFPGRLSCAEAMLGNQGPKMTENLLHLQAATSHLVLSGMLPLPLTYPSEWFPGGWGSLLYSQDTPPWWLKCTWVVIREEKSEEFLTVPEPT